MEADQHHGFQIAEVEPLFAAAGLDLERHETFQLGLNHLFVFRKPISDRLVDGAGPGGA